MGEIEEGVLEHGGRLDGRVILEAPASVGAGQRGARIGPDVRPPAAPFPEFDIVDVRGGAVLNNGSSSC